MITIMYTYCVHSGMVHFMLVLRATLQKGLLNTIVEKYIQRKIEFRLNLCTGKDV